ncbi:MAG: glycosyltransferase [Bryobacteraceae bacterium]
MTNSRALFISAEAPYPLTGGGAMRTASLLSFLAAHHAVDLIVFREPGADDPRAHLPAGLVRRVDVIKLSKHARNTWARSVRNAGRLVRGIPPLMDRFAGFEDAIAAAIQGERYELGIIEHFWCAPYLEQIAEVCHTTVLDLHNIESVLHERCANEGGIEGMAHRVFSSRCRSLEEKWLSRFACVLAASQDDARRVRQISPDSQVRVYPNAIPFASLDRRAREDVIVFSGNLEYHPNISAVAYFRRRIWPELRERRPGLVWRLIGRNPGAIAGIVRGDNRIEVMGPVEDAIGEIARGKVAIVPVLAGSGTRIKILEAWAAGVPVVSTPLGAEGLPVRDGEHLMLAGDAVSFGESVNALLDDGALSDRIGRAGRYLFECEFTWEAAWKALHFLDPCYHGEI